MNSDEKAAKLEQTLLKTRFPQECQELPYDDLTKREKKVVDKCINQEELTDSEFTLLKKTLEKYREYITKYRPSETVEALEDTKDIITTEQELLDILDDEKYKTLKVNLPVNGKHYPMEFEILPIDDSRVVDYLQMDIDLFKDYSEQEKQTYLRAQQGGPVSPEEQAMINKMTQELNAIAGEEKTKMIDGFLASQLRLPNSSSDYAKRKEFWQRFPFLAKWAIVTEVENRLGLTEQANEKLFQVE